MGRLVIPELWLLWPGPAQQQETPSSLNNYTMGNERTIVYPTHLYCVDTGTLKAIYLY